MKLYKAKPTIVAAAQIIWVGELDRDHGRSLSLDDGTQFYATPEMMARMTPAVGDYLVRAEQPGGAGGDVYHYLNPRQVFESKYALIETDAKVVDALQHLTEVAGQALPNSVMYRAKYAAGKDLDKGPGQVAAFTEPHRTQRPSQGRIVIYHHPGSADGRYPPQTSPAIIQQVEPVEIDTRGRCLLFVFGPKGQHMDWSDYGNGPCQWTWPERT